MAHFNIIVRTRDGMITMSPTGESAGYVVGKIVQVAPDLFEARVDDKSIHGINLVRGTSVQDCASQIQLKAQHGDVHYVPDVQLDNE